MPVSLWHRTQIMIDAAHDTVNLESHIHVPGPALGPPLVCNLDHLLHL